jgi:predicted aconitase
MENRLQLSETSASKQSAQLEKGINSAKAQADLSSEKISRMIDILKSFAIEQDKIDQALKVFSADQGKVDQILQGQKGLDATQKKITEALKDLRRKANVNISRSEDVLKKIKKTDDILKKMRNKR